jgi:hypothetical protein
MPNSLMVHGRLMHDLTYLGDGVYAGHDEQQVWIWTDNGIERSKPIALDPLTFAALDSYYQSLVGKLRG